MKRLLILILVTLTIASCGGRRRAVALMERAETIVEERPDSARVLLESVPRRALGTRRMAARHALLYSQALDKSGVDVDSDTLIRRAADYYRFHGTDLDRARIYYYLGAVYDNAGLAIEAIEELKRAEIYAAETDDENLKGLIAFRIGSLYMLAFDYDGSSEWYVSAVEHFAAAGELHNEAIANEMLGRACYDCQEFETARDKERRARELFLQSGDTASAIRLEHSILASRFKCGENTDTIKREFYSYCMAHYGDRLHYQSAGFWADIYMSTDRLDSAKVCIDFILESSDLYFDLDIAGCYFQLSDIEEHLGNYEKAFGYLRRAERMSDSLGDIARKNNIMKFEKEVVSQRLGEEVAELEMRNRLQRMTFLLVTVIALVVIAYIVRLWRHRHFVALERQRRTEAELRTINDTYRHLIERHEAMKQQLDMRDHGEQRVYNAIENRLLNLRSLLESAQEMRPTAFANEFRRQMTVNPRVENALDDLQYVVNKKYYGIIDYLKEHYPELNAQDLDLCALLSFGFSQAGICYIYGYSDIGTFYNKRSRLRKKMNLPEDYGIEDFIQNLIIELRGPVPEEE